MSNLFNGSNSYLFTCVCKIVLLSNEDKLFPMYSALIIIISLCIVFILFWTIDTFYSEDNLEIEDDEGRMRLGCDSSWI